jgi:hypothetical protein
VSASLLRTAICLLLDPACISSTDRNEISHSGNSSQSNIDGPDGFQGLDGDLTWRDACALCLLCSLKDGQRAMAFL